MLPVMHLVESMERLDLEDFLKRDMRKHSQADLSPSRLFVHQERIIQRKFLSKVASPYVCVRVRNTCLHALRKMCVRCAEISLYGVYRCCIDLLSQTLVRLQEQMFAVFTASFWSGCVAS